MQLNEKLTILGAGAWGTALAIAFDRHPNADVTLVTVEAEHDKAMIADAENKRFFPGHELHKSITISTHIPEDTDVLFSVGPAQKIEDIAKRLANDLRPTTPVIFCSKGMYYKDDRAYLMTEIAAMYLSNPLFVLSGPNFAHEVAQGVPSATILAGQDTALAKKLQFANFKIQPSADIAGVQVAGCMKNVFAIASGIYAGFALGMNTRCAFYVQCLHEMALIGALFQADPNTFSGLAGIADLVLTCSSSKSRNASLGMALANGVSYGDYVAKNPAMIEGVFNAEVVQKLKKEGLCLPICDFVYQSIHEGCNELSVHNLLNHPHYLSK